MSSEHSSRAFVAVGSNIEPSINVPAALKRMSPQEGRLVGVSTFYRTAPLGRSDQPAFINGVVELATTLEPRLLKRRLGLIESDLGRQRTSDRSGPRTIDLDLIVHGRLVSDAGDPPLPHPDLARPFVAVPLRELAPELFGDGHDALVGRIAQLTADVDWQAQPGQVLAGLTRTLREMIR